MTRSQDFAPSVCSIQMSRICGAHGMTVKELIEFLLLSRQNLTAVLDRLEERP